MIKKIAALFLSCILIGSFAGCRMSAPVGDLAEEMAEEACVMTVGNTNISLYEYNYTYFSCISEFYSNYSYYLSYFGLDPEASLKEQKCGISESDQTWAEFFMDQTDSLLQQIYYFYNAAVDAGVTLGAEEQTQIDAYVLSATEGAESEELSLDAYLSEHFGSGLNEARFRDILGRRILATQYCNRSLEEVSYTDADYERYYAENRDQVDRVSFRIFTMTEDCLPSVEEGATEDQVAEAVKALAEEFARGLTTEEQFRIRAEAYAPQDLKADYAQDSATLAKNYSYSDVSSNEELTDWLFDSERKPGDVTVLPGSLSAYNICMMVNRSRDEFPLASMRHILLSVTETEENGTAVSDDAKVYQDALSLYDTWKHGAATEDTFAALVADHSDDPGSAENGGLYEDFTRGSMVEEMDDWLYADGRKAGDTGIVKTRFGYHIVYFLGYGDISWKNSCVSGMQDEDFDRMVTDYAAKYSVSYAENYRQTAGNQQ